MPCSSCRLATAAAMAAACICCDAKRDQGRAAGDARGHQPGPGQPALAQSCWPFAADECPVFSSAKRLGKVRAKDLTEASGLAVSQRDPRVLWSHNDAGGKPRLFAMTRSGEDLGSYRIKGAKLVDWEDISLGPGPEAGQWYLYVGDIGSNDQRRDQIVIYRFPEPEVELDQKAKKRKIKNAVQFRLRYPDGASRDMETLMVDPRTSELYLATKTVAAESQVYRAPASLQEDRVTVLELATTLRLSTALGSMPALITGGDIAADGSAVLIRTPSSAYLWPRRDGETIAQALEREPCPIQLHEEPQGEAIALAPTGDSFFTLSEGEASPIRFYPRQH